MIKIMHMADVHFGRAVSGLPENLREIRRQEVRSTFSCAINKANEDGVDVVLIAGDLFESSETDKSTVNFIKGELEKISHIPVFVSPGNHDPLGNAYKMLKDSEIKNLTIFDKDTSKKDFPEKNLTVYGVGFSNEVTEQSLLKDIKAEDETRINIAVIHGELAPNSPYNPISEADIEKTGMDYIALGHVHTYSGIKKSGKTHWAYSGALEGGGFDECGDKGAIFGTVSKEKCDLNLVPLCKRKYVTVELDVSETVSVQEIIEMVKDATVNKDNLYKIVLSGKRPEPINEEVINNEIDAFFSKVKDETRASYDLKAISSDYSIAGIFARNVLERMENAAENEKNELIKASDVVMDILNFKK